MMKFSKNGIEKLRNLIETSQKITLITHYNPDGDALGASAAVFYYLKEKGKDVVSIIPNTFPKNIGFVVESIDYIIAEKEFKKAKNRILDSDCLIVLDMNANHRSGDNLEKVLNETNITKVLLDHHVSPEKYDIVFSYPQASATCEVVYNVLKRLDNKKIFSYDVSLPLYAGILTDTGSFSYSCDHSEVYDVVSNLLKAGLKASKIHQKLFDTYSYHRLSLLGYAIGKKFRFFPEQRAAFIYLTKRELKRFHYEIGDLEGVVNYCLKLEKVDFCALLSEREDKVRMSFRSKDPSVDVNVFARKYWNGGGHVMAAGGKSYEEMDVVVEKLTKQIKEKKFLQQ